MTKKLRSAAVLLLAAALCTASVICTGCGNTKQNSGTHEGSIYMPEVPENIVDENTPGEEFKAGIGETVNYLDKIDVTLNKVIELDDVNKMEYRVLLAEMTITNKSDAKIDCSTLTHFYTVTDGTESVDLVRDVQAAVAARKYYTAIKSPLENFNQAIEAGASVNGYVYIFAPTAWKEMQLVYTPYKYYNTDKIFFNLDETKYEHHKTTGE